MNAPLDVLIRGGDVIDGTGGPPQKADIGIRNGLIARVGVSTAPSLRVIDATGCIVSPGFIDAHSNLSWGLLREPDCSIVTYQGVTTALTGNCGGSAFPAIGAAANWIGNAARDYGMEVSWQTVNEFARRVGNIGADICPLVGHGTLRTAVCGFEQRALTGEELSDLVRLAQESLHGGAFGVSFGLAYPPGCNAGREELLAVCRAAKHTDTPCCFHLRIESDALEEAVAEVVDLSLATGARCVICHHKALGKSNWGKVERTLAMLDRANQEGGQVYSDCYPYTTALRNLAMLLPDWAHEGGRDALVRRLEDPKLREELTQGLRDNARRWDASWNDTLIFSAPQTPHLEGRLASEIVGRSGESGLLDVLALNRGRLLTLYEGAAVRDLEKVLAHDRTMIGSDGNAQHESEAGHPRSFGTFPTVFSRFVLERRLLTLEQAIHKMTGLPAKLFGLSDRGILADGFRADICVFDPSALPGIPISKQLDRPWPRDLFVAGEMVIRNGAATGVRPGQVQLRSQASGRGRT